MVDRLPRARERIVGLRTFCEKHTRSLLFDTRLLASLFLFPLLLHATFRFSCFGAAAALSIL